MKLVQLNTWQGRLLDQIVGFLVEEQPDIMTLQEVYSSKLDTPLLRFFHSLEAITECFPQYHVFFSPTQEMQVLGENVYFGNAIISRFPLENTDTVYINGEYKVLTTNAVSNINIRNLQRTTVRVNDQQTFCILNHHGYWEPNPVGSKVTEEKMNMVADIVSSSKRPLILAGDFNITSYSPAMQPIHKLLKDLTQDRELSTTLSIFGKVKHVACDHVCISEGIKVHSFHVSEAVVSDHLGLVLEFELSDTK